MIEQMLIQTLRMSLTGSIVILAVFLLRFLLRKAPKIFSYCLWAAVLFRLLCPVSFTASFSLFSILQAPYAASENIESETPAYIPQNLMIPIQTDTPPSDADYSAKTEHLPSDTTAAAAFIPSAAEQIPHTAAVLWLLGIAVMIIYNMRNLYKLKQSLKTAILETENIYISQETATPFVIGLLHPRIYLPSYLNEEEKTYVLLHEQIHLKRKDHILKLIGCLALCLHWFNPLVWAAFFLSGKDMEMSCDEAVIRKLGSSVKKPYSCSLLSMATGKTVLSGTPLAFGEGDTGSRIKNILHYKKPAAIVVKGAALLSGIAVIALLANPDIHAEAEPSAETSSSDSASAGTASDPLPSDASADADVASAVSDSEPYDIDLQSIAKETRVIDSYTLPFGSPLEEGKTLSFADDCQFLINDSMNKWDIKEASYDLFASLLETGGQYVHKPCLLTFENDKIVRAVLKSAWNHYGITPLTYIEPGYFYDAFLESEEKDAFSKNYTLISSETMDIADCDGEESIEVYTDYKNHTENCIVLFKNKDGQILFTQDASLSRAGWNNIYLGSINDTPFILTLHIEDRWNAGEFSYRAFRLTSEGNPSCLEASCFAYDLTEGSYTVYDDTIFQEWIAPLEAYLKNSHLIVSTQDGELRTEKISEADKYNYDTLSLKDRISEINASSNDCLICFHDSWYSKRSLKNKTVEWLLWYNSLSEAEQLSVNSITPELIDAKNLIRAGTQEAYAEK